jgi:hypothetical protein
MAPAVSATMPETEPLVSANAVIDHNSAIAIRNEGRMDVMRRVIVAP